MEREKKNPFISEYSNKVNKMYKKIECYFYFHVYISIMSFIFATDLLTTNLSQAALSNSIFF